MARIRTVKPEFFTSEQVVDCSPTARLLFIGMWCFCDDGGVHPASPKRLKMEVFPADNISEKQIIVYVDELVKSELITEFVGHDGKSYWQVTGWHHQKIEKPTLRHPQKSNDSTTIRRPVVDSSPTEGKGKESIGKESKGIDKPDGVSIQVWDDFLKLRKTKKAPLTQTALDGIEREAKKASMTLNDALATCCARGWQSFKADWITDGKKNIYSGVAID